MGAFKEVLKCGLGLMSGFGIGMMMKTGVKVLTPEDANKITKTCCQLGGLVIASALGRVATNEINKTDEDIQTAINNVKNISNEVNKMIDGVKEEEEEDNSEPDDPSIEVVK